ncbi:peptide-methionine (S)-S-oxide reductase MsrA [soil metagenome]
MPRILALVLASVLSVAACAQAQQPAPGQGSPAVQRAVFGGGCFWCVEEAFDQIKGVVATTSGYTGGRTANPTYAQVSSGRSGHVEVVLVEYDPAIVSYDQLLQVFWRNVDPLTPNRQFCDSGPQYRAVIYYGSERERRAAEASRQAIVDSGRFNQPIATEITAAAPFYAAEEYHQDYYRKNPVRYRFYKFSCGRAQRLAELWGDR